MSDKPKSWQNWITYGIVALLVTVGSYVGGYFWLSKPASRTFIAREYEYEALRVIFGPMGWAEAEWTGMGVVLLGPNEVDFYEPRDF